MSLSRCFRSEIHVNASHKLLISKIGGMVLFDDLNSYYHPGEMYRGKVINSQLQPFGGDSVNNGFNGSSYLMSFLTSPPSRGLEGRE